MVRVIIGFCLGLFLLFPASLARAQDWEWEMVRHQFRDYVRVEDIAQFYHLEYESEPKGFVMRHGPLEIRGKEKSTQLKFMGLDLELTYPVIRLDKKWHLSRFDFIHWIDPILRPSQDGAVKDLLKVVIHLPSLPKIKGKALENARKKDAFLDQVAQSIREKLKVEGLESMLVREGDAASDTEDLMQMISMDQGKAIFHLYLNWLNSGSGFKFETEILQTPGSPDLREGAAPWEVERRVFCGNLWDRENLQLAVLSHGELAYLDVWKKAKSRLFRAQKAQLKRVAGPAVMVHFGFSNAKNGSPIIEDELAEPTAQALAKAIGRFKSALSQRQNRVLEAPSPSEAQNSQPTPLAQEPSIRLVRVEGLHFENTNLLEKVGIPWVPPIRIVEEVIDLNELWVQVLSENESIKNMPLLDHQFQFGLRVGLKGVTSEDGQLPNPEKLDLQIYACDLVNREEIHLTGALPPTFYWQSEEPNWEGGREEWVDILYRYPPLENKPANSQKKKGAASDEEDEVYDRQFFGYVVRVVYDGKVLDEVSVPPLLLGHIRWLTTLWPKN